MKKLERGLMADALRQSLVKLAPRTQVRNPVMLVVYIGAILTTVLYCLSFLGLRDENAGYTLAIALILWFTVLFANFAEAIAEGRGRAQADTLRKARTDTTLAGYPVRKGQTVLVVLLALHRDPTLWGEDTEVFDPGRFLPAAVRARPAHAYKPFGVGARACIGRQFALHEAVLALAEILTRFEVAPVPGYEISVTELLTIRPENLRLELCLRER